MHQPRARWRAAVAVMFLAAQVSAVVTPVVSHAQSTTTTTTKPKSTSKQPPIDEGQAYYEQSRFDDAITLLKDLVDQGALQGAELQRARELLARSYVKKGYPVQGKEMFKTMLRADSTYRPDPIRVPPDEAAVFEEALKEYQSETKVAAPVTPAPKGSATTTPTPEKIGMESSSAGKKKGLTSQWWFWAGSAVLVGGIAAAAMGGGGGGETPPVDTTLEGFPGTP